MSLEIINAGFLTTIQDLGRYGYERYGVPVSGAMDCFAMAAANALVGNPLGAAAIETTMSGVTLVSDDDCLVAAAGPGFELYVQNRRLPAWIAVFAHAGERIRLVNRTGSGWGYLAFAGGMDVPQVMGSRATYLRGGFGGLDGKVLQMGDRLRISSPSDALTRLAGRQLPPERRPAYNREIVLEVIPGPQEEAFSPAGLETFYTGVYNISLDSDRMGYRLSGPAIQHGDGADILSDGIVFGSIQVPANGQPIVMMSDRQTTGGYTKIGTVCSADLPLLAQCPFEKGAIRFRRTTVEAAQERYRRLFGGLASAISNADDDLMEWMTA